VTVPATSTGRLRPDGPAPGRAHHRRDRVHTIGRRSPTVLARSSAARRRRWVPAEEDSVARRRRPVLAGPGQLERAGRRSGFEPPRHHVAVPPSRDCRLPSTNASAPGPEVEGGMVDLDPDSASPATPSREDPPPARDTVPALRGVVFRRDRLSQGWRAPRRVSAFSAAGPGAVGGADLGVTRPGLLMSSRSSSFRRPSPLGQEMAPRQAFEAAAGTTCTSRGRFPSREVAGGEPQVVVRPSGVPAAEAPGSSAPQWSGVRRTDRASPDGPPRHPPAKCRSHATPSTSTLPSTNAPAGRTIAASGGWCRLDRCRPARRGRTGRAPRSRSSRSRRAPARLTPRGRPRPRRVPAGAWRR
jgi:hypothetical protein